MPVFDKERLWPKEKEQFFVYLSDDDFIDAYRIWCKVFFLAA